jgi:putative transposase
LHQPENSDVWRLALSHSGHEVARPLARLTYFSLRRHAVLRRSFFELLFDAERVGRGARPEFPQRIPVALAPGDLSLMIFPALAEKGDDAAGELAEGYRVEGRGVESINDEPTVAADPFEAFTTSAGQDRAWHQTLKNRILLENYYLPGDLEAKIDTFVDPYNHRRYHESLSNLTPADVYFGRAQTILLDRDDIRFVHILHW